MSRCNQTHSERTLDTSFAHRLGFLLWLTIFTQLVRPVLGLPLLALLAATTACRKTDVDKVDRLAALLRVRWRQHA